ncbi:TPA_asm: hypothetical protein [Porphyromonas phage phage014a_Kyudai4]|uniref:Uncharacterized protein n=2 Tax=Viruses TaxID=10239 RepID=A0AAT9JD29_9VIRU
MRKTLRYYTYVVCSVQLSADNCARRPAGR